MLPGVQKYKNLQRLREIVQVLIQHGFHEIVDQMELIPYLSFPAKVLRKEHGESERLSTPERFRRVLEELGPTFIKLGQILSTRPDVLPPAYIEELSRLQDSAPPIPFGDVRSVIEEELGWPPEVFFKELDPAPLASASLAQVHGATLHNGDEVVVKVQRPGVEELVERDLSILFDLARLAQTKAPWGEIYDFVDIADDFAHKMRAELDYRKEGFNADKFRKNFSGEPHLYIPKVYWEYTTKQVITIERIHGIKIDDVDAMKAAGIDPKKVAYHSARIIIKEVFIDGFFHADPHPGNFFVMPGEIIGAMDFGLVGHLDRYVREDLAHLLVASVNLDSEAVVDRLIKMGAAGHRVDRVALRRDIGRLLENYVDRPLKEIRAKEVVSEIMPIAFKHHLRLPSDLWLLGKTLGMMEGVGLKLDPDFDMFAVAKPYAHQVIWQFTSPQALGKRTLKGLEEWGELALVLPRRMSSILSMVESGDFGLKVEIENYSSISKKADKMINRVAVSLILAAIILGTSILVPEVSFQWPWGLETWLIVVGLFVVATVGALLAFSILRTGGA